MSEPRDIIPADFDLKRLEPGHLNQLSDADFRRIMKIAFRTVEDDKRENQLLYYMPASPKVEAMHASPAFMRAMFGGNRSSKTTGMLAEGVIQATGVIPHSLRQYEEKYMKQLRGPVNGRIICQSLVNILEPTILPKLRWNSWNGSDEIGGKLGHWGLIPRTCLIDGEWERSWSAKSRTLRVLYRNPENIDEIMGESTIQFFSYDQKPEDFASAHCHFVLFDEPPTLPIWNENKIRVMSANGWLALAMTWPDDPSINVDWLYEEIYEKGTEGSPSKVDGYECFELHTTDNIHLNQAAVAEHMATMDERQKRVRIFGQQVRFSNRVHELFTDTPRGWCFTCGEDSPVLENKCLTCGSEDAVTYCHVEEFGWNRGWPVIWVLDPHPRKPHMSAWIGVDPNDDYCVIADLDCKGDPVQLRAEVEAMEEELGLRTVRRLVDPRMAQNPSGAIRDRTWLDEFDAAGLYCEPAQSSDVGRELVDQFLRPDHDTGRPRLIFHPRCTNAIYQMKRFMWEDWRAGTDKDQKQKAKQKNDDYPAILRYFCNDEPRFSALVQGGRTIQTPIRHYPTRGVSYARR